MPLYRDDAYVQQTNGPIIDGAQVYYLNNQPNSVTTTVDLTQLITLYSDSTGVIQITNPMVTDEFGHANSGYPDAAGYMAAGFYTIVSVVNGSIYEVLNDQLVGETENGGSVTSVALTMPSNTFSVAGSPITGGGTFVVTEVVQQPNTFFAGPSSGSPATPTWRTLNSLDLPNASRSLVYISDFGAGAPTTNFNLHAVAMSYNSTTINMNPNVLVPFTPAVTGMKFQIPGAAVNGGTLFGTLTYVSATQATSSVACSNTNGVTISDIFWWTNGQQTIDQTALTAAQNFITANAPAALVVDVSIVLSAGITNVQGQTMILGGGMSQTAIIASSSSFTSHGLAWTDSLGFIIGTGPFGFTLAGPGFTLPAIITAGTISGTNTAAFTVSNSVTFPIGSIVLFQGGRGTLSPTNDILFTVTGSTTSLVTGTIYAIPGTTAKTLTNGTFTDCGTVNLNQCGVYIECTTTGSGADSISQRFRMTDLHVEGFPGDLYEVWAPNFGYMGQLSGQYGAGGRLCESLTPSTGAFSVPSAFEVGGGNRMVSCFKYGCYDRSPGGYSIGVHGNNNCGCNMVVYNGESTVSSQDLEVAIDQCPAWPGYCFEMRGVTSCVLTNPLMQVGPTTVVGQTMLYIWDTSKKWTVLNPSFQGQGSYVEPTYEFYIDSTSGAGGWLINPSMLNTTHWADASGQAKVVQSNVDQNPVTFNGAATGTLNGVVNVEGSLIGALNNDIIIGLYAAPLVVNVGSLTGTKVEAIRGDMSLAAITGTPGFVIDIAAAGTATNGFGFYEAGNNPNQLNGSLVVNNTILSNTLTVVSATPTGTSGQIGFGNTRGFGNGSAGTAVTTTTKSSGSGPTNAATIVNYLEIDIGGTKYWLPLVQ